MSEAEFQHRDDHDAGNGTMAARMQRLVEEVQAEICQAFERVEGKARFRNDRWERPGGGGGLTHVMEDGAVFEKAGVNTSAVHGMLPDRMAAMLGVEAAPFFATGVSLVVHPRSPHVPTVHANFRYFAVGEDLTDPDDQWFGGGADLTPYYPRLEDVQHFHRVWRDVCDRHPAVADYEAFKQQCDEYFFLQHRDEARGVGGIFYDYLRDDPEALYRFSHDAAHAFLDSYLPIVERRGDVSFGAAERAFQALRRGRYVEFNLVYDRGTRFGLETSGRTESILMSLPPKVEWHYDAAPEPGTPEARLAWFLQPRPWFEVAEEDVPRLSEEAAA